MSSRLRRLLLGAGLVLTIGVGAAAAIMAWRAVYSPTVEIRNGTAQSVGPITCTLSADGTTWSERVAHLDPGASFTVKRFTADLFLNRLDVQIDGATHSWQDGGLATPGEALQINLSEKGAITVAYSRR